MGQCYYYRYEEAGWGPISRKKHYVTLEWPHGTYASDVTLINVSDQDWHAKYNYKGHDHCSRFEWDIFRRPYWSESSQCHMRASYTINCSMWDMDQLINY